MLTPAEMEFLLHCHTKGDKFERIDLPLFQSIARDFYHDGIIREKDEENFFETTEKGKFWIEDMLSTPMPKQVWVSGRTTERGEG